MLKDRNSSAIIAVADLDRARRFYEQTLGLTVADDMGEVLSFATGGTHLVVYRSDEAGTNRANAVVWGVGEEIEAIVADLRGKGVSFEHYDLHGVDFADGLHRSGEFRMAWFKDPDGNILHLNSGD
jgi:catechol 2,3-dioxygenase-like lactoylglutathione lyase family enzyme